MYVRNITSFETYTPYVPQEQKSHFENLREKVSVNCIQFLENTKQKFSVFLENTKQKFSVFLQNAKKTYLVLKDKCIEFLGITLSQRFTKSIHRCSYSKILDVFLTFYLIAYLFKIHLFLLFVNVMAPLLCVFKTFECFIDRLFSFFYRSIREYP